MEYIKVKDKIYVNKEGDSPIIESSFLVEIKENIQEKVWVPIRERDIITFSRYVDGYALHGVMGFFENHKIRKRKFKGLE